MYVFKFPLNGKINKKKTYPAVGNCISTELWKELFRELKCEISKEWSLGVSTIHKFVFDYNTKRYIRCKIYCCGELCNLNYCTYNGIYAFLTYFNQFEVNTLSVLLSEKQCKRFKNNLD